jgi:hypothetical protein
MPKRDIYNYIYDYKTIRKCHLQLVVTTPMITKYKI